MTPAVERHYLLPTFTLPRTTPQLPGLTKILTGNLQTGERIQQDLRTD
jgi:hypothetical protein